MNKIFLTDSISENFIETNSEYSSYVSFKILPGLIIALNISINLSFSSMGILNLIVYNSSWF